MKYGWTLIAMLGVTLTACGDDDGDKDLAKGTVSDHSAALTASGGDALFEIVIDEAKETYDLINLDVTVTDAQGNAHEAVLSLANDADQDGKVGQGDTVLVTEGATNAFDDQSVGETFDFQILWDNLEEQEPFLSGSWEATN